MLSPNPRLLEWEDSQNTRELGGYPLPHGGQTRWKTLIRSETSFRFTKAGQQALHDYGVRTVIDLRFPSELVNEPSPFAHRAAGPDGIVDYVNIPLDVDQDLVWPTSVSPAEAMCDLYVRLLETNRGHIAATLSAIARARLGGVLFHCHAGKDRTGLITALVLGAVGAPPEVIAADYALAHPLFEQRRLQSLNDPVKTHEERRYLEVLTSALPETMLLTLDYLDRHYGGVGGFLRTTPLLPVDLELLRERLTNRATDELRSTQMG